MKKFLRGNGGPAPTLIVPMSRPRHPPGGLFGQSDRSLAYPAANESNFRPLNSGSGGTALPTPQSR